MVPQRPRGANRGKGRATPSSPNQTIASLKQKIESLANSIKGKVLSPSLLPPSYVSQPWNNITVELRRSSTPALSSCYEVDVGGALCSQAGLFIRTGSTANYLTVEWRLHSICAWAIEATSFRLVAQDFLVQESLAELTNVASFAQKNMYACTGYEWPMSHQTHVFSTEASDKDKKVIFQLQSDKNSSIIIHARCSWRCADQGKVVPSFELDPRPASPPTSFEIYDASALKGPGTS